MVMDGTPGTPSPSPQCVGREFVRQYYTLLNEAPQFLHRFYSHNSSFIHGVDDKYQEENPPVIGQMDIHKKIQSLNFKNCHAKIRFVDSQATIGSGVVIQVTGELSNDGKPLRRFMQSFVLAPQSANKYYVHNDIFRYQDQVFCETDEEEEYEPGQEQPHQSLSATATRQQHISPEQEGLMAQEQGYEPSASIPQVSRETNAIADSNQSGHVDPPLTNGHHPAHLAPKTAAVPIVASTEPDTHEPAVEIRAEPELAVVTSDEGVLTQSAHSPMSWARLVDQSERQALAAATQTSTGPQSGSQSGIQSNIANMQEEFPSEKPDLGRATMRNNRPDGSLTKGFGDLKLHNIHDSVSSGLPRRMEEPRMDDRRMDERRMDERRTDDRRMERVKYPDGQQIFVGSLPPNVSEFELRDAFKEYGKVLEVRISRSVGNKAPFGFVVFGDEESAQKALLVKTIELQHGQRVNIEKKNNRSSSGPRQGGRRENQKYMYNRGGGGGDRRNGYGGGSRDEGRNRSDQGRYYSNKSNPAYQH